MGKEGEELLKDTDARCVKAEDVIKWSPDRVAEWATSKGFTEYAPALKEHNISGKALFALSKEDLKEIGFGKVGTRLDFVESLANFRKSERTRKRNEVLWEGDQFRPGACLNMCTYGFPCCCFMPPPDRYTLNNFKLSLREAQVGCCPLCSNLCSTCFGFPFTTTNFDLSDILSVDTILQESGCQKFGIVRVTSVRNATAELYIDPDEVQQVSNTIQHAIEEAEELMAGHQQVMGVTKTK